MAKITKACKGTSYPKSSSVSRRLGSPAKAQRGKSVSKRLPRATRFAQEKIAYEKPIKGKYESSTSPKVPSMTTPGITSTYDSTGYAAGAKKFPMKKVLKNPKTGNVTGTYYYDVTRRAVKKAIKRSERKAKRAQNGKTIKVSGSWEGPGSPITRAYADTSGYSAGQKRFPATVHTTGKATKTTTVGRRAVKKAIKKGKTGTSLGMKSVKAGYDKNPGVTRADIIVAAKKQAKKGMKMKRAQSGTMTKRCQYGCK